MQEALEAQRKAQEEAERLAEEQRIKVGHRPTGLHSCTWEGRHMGLGKQLVHMLAAAVPPTPCTQLPALALD